MPELPEVETVCRVIRRALSGKRITRVEVVPDSIVFSGVAPAAIERAFERRTVSSVGRRGKYFWLAFAEPGPTVFGHLGMSGWVRELATEGTRLHGHGRAPFDDEQGRARFLKLALQTRDGSGIVLTDPRRLGRIWLGDSPESDRRIERLGRDAYDDLPSPAELRVLFGRRRIAIKAVLLDQSALSGIGNWIADEVLYQSRLSPKRSAASLTPSEVTRLRRAIRAVLDRAVKVGADHKRFPKFWLFEHRWGGTRGATQIAGQRIVREEVGGRTTAWVPALQK